MHHLLLSLATTPSPMPTPALRDGLSEDQVTPGLWGFIMTAFFVVATTLLIIDMVRRIRTGPLPGTGGGGPAGCGRRRRR